MALMTKNQMAEELVRLSKELNEKNEECAILRGQIYDQNIKENIIIDLISIDSTYEKVGRISEILFKEV